MGEMEFFMSLMVDYNKMSCTVKSAKHPLVELAHSLFHQFNFSTFLPKYITLKNQELALT